MSTQRLPFAVALLTFLFYLPILPLGFITDFFWLTAFKTPSLTAHQVDFETARALWSQMGVDSWWASADFKWTLWRPVSTALLRLQYLCFSTNATAFHLVSLFSYLALLFPLWRLYLQFLEPRMAGIALLLFALHFSHFQVIWFYSNQHAIFSVLFCLYALIAQQKSGGPWDWVWLLAGLSMGETSVGMMGYCLSIGLAQGIQRALPATFILSAYLIAHHYLGYTTQHSLLYLDPSAGLQTFLVGALPRLPALLTGSFNVLPADLWNFLPALRPFQLVVALILSLQLGALLALAWPSWSQKERQGAVFSLGGLLSLIPASASFPGGRLLLPATLGSCLLLVLLYQSTRQGWYRVILAPLLLVNLCMPLMTIHRMRALYQTDQAVQTAAIQSVMDDTRPTLVISLPSQDFALNILSARNIYRNHAFPPAWWVLSVAALPQRLYHIAHDTLELELLEGQMFDTDAQLLFAPAPFPIQVGARFVQAGMEVEVLAADTRGPTRLRYQFPQSLAQYQILSWQEGRLQPLALPALGAACDVPLFPTPY